MPLTAGQELALEQLTEVAALSGGELELIDEPEEMDGGSVRITLSLRTRAYRTGRGMALRDRERLRLYVPAEFPFRRPSLFFADVRHKGEPHVQWGSSICLFQAPEAEWQPSDGMYGFLDRVHEWFAAAGAGALDPDDAPLHPPVTYSTADLTIVARADAPALTAGVPWLGRANMRKVGSRRLDLVGWTSLADWTPDLDGPTSDAFALLLARPLPMEFPTTVRALTAALADAGADLPLLLPALRLTALSTPTGHSAVLVVGAPMRRRAADEPVRQHLTAWRLEGSQVDLLRNYALGGSELDIEGVAEWLVGAKVEWCTVLEDRAEILNRRDRGSRAAWIKGRKVLLLGCGALGSTVAELLARADASSITLVDNGIVKPGILVRQRYADEDIGRSKAHALRDRLLALGLGAEVKARLANLAVQCALDDEHYDLIVDATASQSVSHRLEEDLGSRAAAPPLLTMTVSAAALHGSVMVRMPECRHGPVGLSRIAKLAAFSRDPRHALVLAFWPSERPEPFQPEPGCSEPTFSGSAADVEHHAAGLLNVGLTRIGTSAPDGASLDLVAAQWTETTARSASRLRYQLQNWRRVPEKVHGYNAFLSPQAWGQVETEMRRIKRVRSDEIETGGLMLGEVDEAHRTIWIDAVTGPPPDSEASAERFVCGTAGIIEVVDLASRRSGGSSRFVGTWHTHPVSEGAPSRQDMAAMVQLLHLQERPPRRTAMLIVGHAATAPQPALFLFRRQDFQIVLTEGGVPA